MTLAMWLTFASIHIIYVPDFMLHIAALKKPACICSLPFVDPAPENATEAKKAAVAKAVEEREYLCNYQCPPVKGECPLVKEEGQSDAEYLAACAALKDQAKAEEEAPLESADVEEEEEEEDLEEEDEEEFEAEEDEGEEAF